MTGEVGRETEYVWVIWRVDAAERVGKVHVDFDEEVCEELKGGVVDVVWRTNGKSSLLAGGNVEEKP